MDLVGRLRAAGCVFAEEEAALLREAATDPDVLDALAARRCAGEPLEHVVGWARFADLRIVVGPGVFVPRRRTEFLAATAIARTSPGDVVVDLCCGAGALGAAVLAAVPDVEVWAADLDPVAVGYARQNLPPDRVLCGDLDEPLPTRLRGSVAVLVANVPYVPSDAVRLLPTEAREHEPRVALDGGADGLAVLRRVAALAPAWLRPGGVLLSEVSGAQCPTAVEVLAAVGLRATAVTSEDGTTVVGGVLRHRPR